jgi:hypothetical protein
MNSSPPRNESAPGETAPGLEELRALLIGTEQERLAQLEAAILERKGRTEAVAEVLVEAVRLRAENDPEMARALRQIVEETLRLSVKKTPVTLAETLFPVFGPAIRRTITHALGAATENLSRTIDQTVTPRAIGWRIEAMRTGRSFGEIVLLRTLEYRVEHAYLIHRDSGLLVLHEHLAGATAADAGLVSAMMTAIRDFAKDSFEAQSDLDRFQLGELTVHVETGPSALLAVVVRGTPPTELPLQLAEALEGVHRRFSDELADYQGDPALFEVAREHMTDLLTASYRNTKKSVPKPVTKPAPWRRWAFLGAALASLVGGAVYLELGRRDRAQWQAFFDALRQEPGLVITNTAERGGKWIIDGLRDPLAPDVSTFLKQRGLPLERLQTQLRPYVSLEPAYILKRAQIALEPPGTLRLEFANGVLSVAGQTTATWLARAKSLAVALPGVTRLETSRVQLIGAKP